MPSIQLIGVEKLQKRLKEISTQMKTNSSSITHDVAEVIKSQAIEYCPEDTGRLASTIRIEDSTTGVKQGRNTLGQFTSEAVAQVSILAGDETTPHALAVHEYPSRFNPPTWEGTEVHFTKGGPKFLERALKDHQDNFFETMRKKLMRGIK
jgi:hypothetical protein